MGKLSALPPNTSPVLGDKIPTVQVSGPNDVLVTISAIAALITPPGMISAYGNASAPTGWLLCDGTAVSRTTYATLFGVIGTSYGAGDGSTTFNLPNLQGRVPVGKNGATFSTMGGTGGEEAHTLTIAEMPSHTHGTDMQANIAAAGGAIGGQGARVGDLTDATGGGGSHNNLQPYQVVSYIVKT